MTAARADLPALTGIRFVAAIFVFNAHLRPPDEAPAVLHGFALAGHDWMTMFFILSGLVLTWNYADVFQEGLDRRSMRGYAVARFARIYPLYLAALVLAVLPLGSPSELGELLRDPTTWLHLFALQTWSGDLDVAYDLNGPGWSIGVEIFLYALFPVIIVAFRRIRADTRALVVVAVLAVLVAVTVTFVLTVAGPGDLPREDPWSAHRWLYRTPLTRLPDFVLGVALGYLVMRPVPPARRWGLAAQAVGAVAVLGMMLIPALAESTWSLDAANMIPFALLFLGLCWTPDSGLARVLASRAMVFLGECSFAFYLLHATVVDLVGEPHAGYVDWATTWVLAFVVTLFVAIGAHVAFERPARLLVRRVLDPRLRAPIPGVRTQ
jgi:peptidoglycan/LPS O-acetylase OafA/YrhL